MESVVHLSRHPGRAVAILVALLLLAACSRPADEADLQQAAGSPPAPELQELPPIGGAQDVWALPFGMDADREVVREVFGEPIAVERPDQESQGEGPQIVRWRYEGLLMTFLIERGDLREYLLSVRISDPQVPINGGLEIGMPVREAVELLGEPRVVNEDSRVYFYRNTTIELVVRDDHVRTIHLARALP